MSGRGRFIAAILPLPILIVTLTIYNSKVIDGYFLWIHLSKGLLRIYWERKPILTFKFPLNLCSSLWIPAAPLALIILYVLIVGRKLNFRVSIHGRRIHHYHVGMLLIGFSVALALTSTCLAEPKIIWFGWRKTSLQEILDGLSFAFAIGGVALILSDLRDVVMALTGCFGGRQA